MRRGGKLWTIREYKPDNAERMGKGGVTQCLSHDIQQAGFVGHTVQRFQFHYTVMGPEKLGLPFTPRTTNRPGLQPSLAVLYPALVRQNFSDIVPQ